MTTATDLKLPDLRLFYGGEFHDAKSGRTIAVTNPATGHVFAHVHEADASDVDAAVAAARDAAEGWARTAPTLRSRLMRKLAELIDANKVELARLESTNQGKRYSEALKGDIPLAVEVLHYYAGIGPKTGGRTIPLDSPAFAYTLREPYGVCAQIIPWNFPILMASWKLGPALATGNVVVLKPSELTPLTALRIAELAKEAGFPPGVVNVINGFGNVAGEALARHMGVDKIAFTGSERTGRAIVKASAESNLKKVSLELGGKSPHIVFGDADLKAASVSAFWGIFMNKGEVCAAGSRLLVHRSVHDELVGMLQARAAKMKLGNPLEQVDMGPVVSARQLETVLGYIQSGKDQGATAVTGGERATENGLDSGYFVKPTIFTGVKPEMKISQEEIFGPVLAVLPFDDEAEAIKLANGTTYGLVSGVWTKDVGRAHRMARALKAGTVWVNDYNAFDVAAPFGGYGQSGWGRELGEEALDLYTQTKSVWVRTDR